MHAVLVKVRIDPSRRGEALAGLHEIVVPQAKGTPGFVRGTWIGDGPAGYGVLVFQSEEQAQQMAGAMGSPPDAPAQIEQVEVYEVQAEADNS